MSENTPHLWGENHYCAKDARHLMYHPDGNILRAGGYPELDPNPERKTYCSYCLQWFADPAKDEPAGSGTRPPEKGTPDETPPHP